MKTLLAALALASLATAVSADDSTPRAEAPISSQPHVGNLATFEFSRGSARLDAAPAGELRDVVSWIADNPDGLIVLDGHAESSRGKVENLRLSFARAKAVRAKLVSLGVDPDHIVVAAFGANGPQDTRDRNVVAWGTRAGMKAVVSRTRAIGQSLVSTGLLTELALNPRTEPPEAVAAR